MSTLVPPEPGNRFRFRFVFVSCVRASGRGEAAWAREGRASSTLGFRVRNFPASSGTFSCLFAGIRVVLCYFCPKVSSQCLQVAVFCVGFKGF